MRAAASQIESLDDRQRPIPAIPRAASAVVLSLLGLGALMAGPSRASYTILNGGAKIEIWGTGRTSTNSGPKGTTNLVNNGALSGALSVLEETWKLIAFPNDYVTTDLTLPGNLYIPNKVPGGWAGQTGGNNTPVDGYRWITYANWAGNGTSYGTKPAGDAYATSYFRPSESGVDYAGMVTGMTPKPNLDPPYDYYSYITQTTFTPSKSGLFRLSTSIAADNFIEVYLGGTVDTTDSKRPTITGGQKLLQLANVNTSGLFANLLVVQDAGVVSLNAGQSYDLNYVIRDNCSDNAGACNFGQTGFLVGATAFTEQVPGPLPVLGVVGFFHQARRLRRKLARKSG